MEEINNKYSKENIDEGLHFYLNNSTITKKDIVKEISINRDIKTIVVNIKNIVDKLSINLENKDLDINELRCLIIERLENSDNLEDIGISKIIEDIYRKDNNNFIIDNSSAPFENKEFCQKYIEKEGISNFIVFKIQDFSKLESLFGKEESSYLISQLYNNYKTLEKNINNIFISNIYMLSYNEFGITFSSKSDFIMEKAKILKAITFFLKNLSIKSKDGYTIHIKHTLGGVFNDNKNTYNKAKIALDYAEENNIENKSYNHGEDIKTFEEYKNYSMWVDRIQQSLISQLNGQEGNLEIYHQGIVNNNTGKIEKYESLIRYNHKGEIKSPYFFMEHADKAQITIGITCFVLIETAKLLKKDNSLEINININAGDVLDNIISRLLSHNSPNAKNITLEILENSFDEKDEEEILKKLIELKKIGYKIAIDDFGAGHSNFRRLNILKPDILKIDGSLISGIDKDKDKMEIVNTIVKLGHLMGSEIVAEFVETKEEQEVIMKLGIDYTQGYLYSKPEKLSL